MTAGGGACSDIAGVFPPPRLISDELWALVEPLIPQQRPAVHGHTGRPRTSGGDALEQGLDVHVGGVGRTHLATSRHTVSFLNVRSKPPPFQVAIFRGHTRNGTRAKPKVLSA